MNLQVHPRNHPLLLLSGVATNAIGYDLSPEVILKSFSDYCFLFFFLSNGSDAASIFWPFNITIDDVIGFKLFVIFNNFLERVSNLVAKCP